MGRALEDAHGSPQRFEKRLAHITSLAQMIWNTLAPFVVSRLVLPTGGLPPQERAPHHVSFCVRGHHRRHLLPRFERLGVFVSAGSACSTSSLLPSHVLAALQIPVAYIHGSIRITLSHTNTEEEVRDRVCPALRYILEQLVNEDVQTR